MIKLKRLGDRIVGKMDYLSHLENCKDQAIGLMELDNLLDKFIAHPRVGNHVYSARHTKFCIISALKQLASELPNA